MKIVFVSVNAKYIHTSPAVRILNKIASKKYDSTFYEFTIKDNINHMIDLIKDYDVILFSAYIWSIEIIKKLSHLIKENYKNIVTVVGGPEVSYDTKSFVNDFDYVISGEGEEIIIPFLDEISNKTYNFSPYIAYKGHENAIPYVTKDLSNVPDILDTYTESDRLNRIIYVETTRGCPFSCSYCLSSLEKGVRFFSDEYINNIFLYIKSHKFKCIKFLDRTFNVNPSRFLNILKLLEETENTYQFEIAAELFNDDVINYFLYEAPVKKYRLEIGVQSLLDEAIKSVSRAQDNERLIKIIKSINEKGRATIHTDLICGLPYENLDSFKNTFNKTFLLLSEELQLGFLKMLRGTKIRLESDMFSYTYDENPPYEVIKNKFMSEGDIKEVHMVEESLEFLWNSKRAKNLILHLISDNKVSDFYTFFKGFYSYYKKDLPLHENYINICNYLKDLSIYNNDYLDDLKLDFLTKSRVKPMPFWKDRNSDSYHEKEYDYKILGLDESYFNSFITSYYDKILLIKYEKGKDPILEIKNISNKIGIRK